MAPSASEHYRTLCDLVEKAKNGQGCLSDYQQVFGYKHVVHQRKVALVDIWNLRAYNARKKEPIVLP